MAEEEKKEEEAAAEGAAPPPAGGGSKLVLVLTALNLIIVLGIAAVMAMSFQKEQAHPEVSDITTDVKPGEEPPAELVGIDGQPLPKTYKNVREFGVMIDIEQLTVNLSTSGSANPKFARVNMSIEVPNEDVEAEVSRRMPEVRNTIIDLFNAKRPSDLASPEGKNYLKEEIRNALNSFLITGKVSGVFFTNFAISG